MNLALLSLFVVSCFYLVLETVLALLFRNQKGPVLNPDDCPSFCQVKPLYKPGEATFAAIDTFREQCLECEHKLYLCSAQEAPQSWLETRPEVQWLELHSDQSQNGKAATLALASESWDGDIFVISDGDMTADKDYLERVLAEFSDPSVGVVTCIYTAEASGTGSLGQLFESLCMLDFAGSVLVCELTEGISFAMGSTMAIRRQALEDIGGFEALVSYLADDYQLGNKAHRAGWKVRLARTVMRTQVDGVSLAHGLAHQYRWLVTSRASRPGGHLAFVVTQGFLWSMLLGFASTWTYLLSWCALRVVLGWLKGRALSSNWGMGESWRVLFLPGKDALYIVLWVRSLFGTRVSWGNRRITLGPGGLIADSELRGLSPNPAEVYRSLTPAELSLEFPAQFQPFVIRLPAHRS